jgi:ABC-2 type transport system ATP-binding protein
MIELKNLVKKFGSFVAVDDINLTIEEGQFFGFLGPNVPARPRPSR